MTPMLARTYDGIQPIDGWLMSEKLDGVRAIWDGQKLVSRNGNEFAAPKWFTSALPSGIVLDGELFAGRGKFQATLSVVKKKTPVDAEWSKIRFCVFDAPKIPTGFENRLTVVGIALHGNPMASLVSHRICRDAVHLAEYLAAIVASGGEGVMLREPGSKYMQCRSSSMLKHKPIDTAEAVVVATDPGEGRCAGQVGALVVWWNEKLVRIGSGLTDDIRDNPPASGSKITFRYCGVTDSGTPRFPVFVGVRDYE